jgi:hypothetical protein
MALWVGNFKLEEKPSRVAGCSSIIEVSLGFWVKMVMRVLYALRAVRMLLRF